ncbi:MAG: hypothetical protein ACPHX7_06255 [Candidatus Puniceispirillaceae bacterium]
MNNRWLRQDLLTYEIEQQGNALKEAHVRGILQLSDPEVEVLEQARDLMEDLAEQAAEDVEFADKVAPNPRLWFRQQFSDEF